MMEVVFSWIFGSIFGSFVTCWCERRLNGKSVRSGRSQCDACGRVLLKRDLIPIFSYLALRGRCRYCGAKIDKISLFNELAGAFCFAYFSWRWGWHLWTLRNAVLVLLLMAVTTIDEAAYIIPDSLIAAGVLWWVVTAYLCHQSLLKNLLGACVLAGLVWITALAMDHVLNRESLGGGDIKLFFMTGLFVGCYFVMWHLLFSACIGLVIYGIRQYKESDRIEAIPFGPAIAVSTLLTIILEPILVRFLVVIYS
ncbi:prepilin peptidase [Pseudoramibacter sp.]|jgi:leader peptidase (prepilin peptidase)/N-methyltransferase|uniref:prepilin peptidase n=1 Tax=Pseudoramibacter sp. TaxID=2034862 RepID=UPI0025D88096|nr:A24 family peptidase [Pseudoramibacter sp.]MCH4072741.1 A24 family peptidase [Pseudoramibacter sp.]MCH4106512.1 A24 family peptidase [Pseudoramibacter sp.]